MKRYASNDQGATTSIPHRNERTANRPASGIHCQKTASAGHEYYGISGSHRIPIDGRGLHQEKRFPLRRFVAIRPYRGGAIDPAIGNGIEPPGWGDEMNLSRNLKSPRLGSSTVQNTLSLPVALIAPSGKTSRNRPVATLSSVILSFHACAGSTNTNPVRTSRHNGCDILSPALD